MRIGELAKQAQVTQRTVRYYEQLGLIPLGKREGTGQHRYPQQTVDRLKKIDQLKRLGLSLEEIGGVIDLYFGDPTGKRAKVHVLNLLRTHLAEVEQQMASLEAFGAELRSHITRFERWLDEHTG